MICSLCVCVFSVLMFVLLSRDEPANALCPQDGVCGEARDEEDREDQQPVDALHRDAREGAEMIWIHHGFVGGGFKPLNTNSLSENTACLIYVYTLRLPATEAKPVHRGMT